MSLPNIVLTGPPEMAEDHHILGTGGPLGQWSKKLISNPAPPPSPLPASISRLRCDITFGWKV